MKNAISHLCLSIAAVVLFVLGLYGAYASLYFALAPMTGSEPEFSTRFLAFWTILWILITMGLFTGSVLAARELRRRKKSADEINSNSVSDSEFVFSGINISIANQSDISASYEQLVRFTHRRLIPLLAIAIGLPYILIWGIPGFPSPTTVLTVIAILFFAPVIAIIPHELLHWIGWRVSGDVRWRDVQFGIQRKPFAVYIHSKVPMSARSYRIGLMLPGLVLGITPVAIGLTIGSGILALIGVVMLSTAGGDIMILWKMHGVDGSRRISDLEDSAGVAVHDGESIAAESS